MTSKEFLDLEKRCKRLNMKHSLRILFFIILAIVIFIFVSFYPFEDQIMPVKNPTIRKKSDINLTQKVSKVVFQKNNKKNSITAKPAMKSDKQEVNLTKKIIKIEYNTIFLHPTIDLPKIITLKNRKKQKRVKKPKKIEKDTLVKAHVEKRKIEIKIKSLDSEKKLLKINSAGENFMTAINLSKFYYKKSKFLKAIEWAKKANYYKKNSFEPWLVYAKSKIKLGEKDEAIKAVEMFLSYFDSNSAERFLKKIKESK